jgi:hypothetical protein
MPAKSKGYKFFLADLEKEGSITLKPKKIGSIPKMAVLLGLLSPQFYEIYNLCDGKTDIAGIAANLHLDNEQARMYIDKLIKSKMIEI